MKITRPYLENREQQMEIWDRCRVSVRILLNGADTGSANPSWQWSFPMNRYLHVLNRPIYSFHELLILIKRRVGFYHWWEVMPLKIVQVICQIGISILWDRWQIITVDSRIRLWVEKIILRELILMYLAVVVDIIYYHSV